MSYRLITKANLIVAHLGASLETVADLRAYQAPKRAASGNLNLNGVDVEFRRTGGKGRGLLARNYIYFTLKGESVYTEVTEAQALAITAGGAIRVEVITPAAAEVATPDAPDTAEALETMAAGPLEQAPKATRRSRK